MANEMNKKYEFTGETKTWFGRTLRRIRALIRIEVCGVNVGDLGGWIETEEHLAHSGSAWVGGNARVWGNAEVGGNARVWGNAEVYGDALVGGNALVKKTENYMVVGPMGSRNACTTFFNNKDGRIMVTCGCFRGDIDEFLAAVEKTHGDSKHARVYRAAVALAKEQVECEKAEE